MVLYNLKARVRKGPNGWFWFAGRRADGVVRWRGSAPTWEQAFEAAQLFVFSGGGRTFPYDNPA